MAKLFTYAVIQEEQVDKDGVVTEAAVLLIPPTDILAKDDKQAQLLAGRAIPEESLANLDRLVVVVRPF